jgi:hypothetical protein
LDSITIGWLKWFPKDKVAPQKMHSEVYFPAIFILSSTDKSRQQVQDSLGHFDYSYGNVELHFLAN